MKFAQGQLEPEIGEAERLFDLRDLELDVSSGVAPTVGGQRFLAPIKVDFTQEEENDHGVVLVFNWFAEFKERTQRATKDFE